MGRESPPRQPRQTGLIPMLLFWFAVMGLLYGLMTHYLKPKQSQVLANGDLVIPRDYIGYGFRARMKALMNLPSTVGAMALAALSE